jgi:uncharacterized damage-inducible protein DinB
VSTPAGVLRDAFTYHLWAMEVLFDALDAATAEQLDAAIPGTYGSIAATLTHTVDADERYLQRLSGVALPPYEEHDAQPVAELRARMREHAARWSETLASLEAGDLHAAIEGDRDVAGGIDPAESLLLNQAVHHGNDHRTQVCSTLGALGLEVPDIDVWTYFDRARR